MNRKIIFSLLSLLLAKASFSQDTIHTFNLVQAQAYALENSYQAQTAELDIEKAERKRKETIAIGLPQLNAEASYQSYIQQPVQLVPGEFFGQPGEFAEVSFVTEQQMSAGATANQLIFDGSYIVGLQASKVYLQLSKNQKLLSDIEVKNQVAKAYAQVLIAERNASILGENLKNLEQSAYETSELYKSGFLEEQDSEQLELLVANIKNSHDNALRQVDISKNLLKFQMGKPISESIVLTDSLEGILSQTAPQGFLNTEFDVKQHIEYKSMLTQQQATELLWKREKTNYLPRISAFYNYQQNSFSDQFDFFTNAKWYPTQVWGLNLSLPIFSSFGRYHKVQQAKIEMLKVEINRQQISEALQLEVENSRSEYVFAFNQYEAKKRSIDLAQRIYNKTKIKFEEGISSSLELTQASNQLLESQGEYVSASFQLINAKINLDKALNNY